MKRMLMASLVGAIALVIVVFAAATSSRVQAQDNSIVGTWMIGADVVMSFHPDGTVMTVTEFSLTHPDTPQIGIWWQDGETVQWWAQGFTGTTEMTGTVTVTGTIAFTSADEISVDPRAEIALRNGASFVDEPPVATGVRMVPPTGS